MLTVPKNLFYFYFEMQLQKEIQKDLSSVASDNQQSPTDLNPEGGSQEPSPVLLS